jgi:hypothetical protein
MVTFTFVNPIFVVPIMANPVKLVFSQSGREMSMFHLYPRTSVIVGSVPVAISVGEIKVIKKKQVIRHSDAHIKTESARIDEFNVIINAETVVCRLRFYNNHPIVRCRLPYDYLLRWWISYLQIKVNADICCIGSVKL